MSLTKIKLFYEKNYTIKFNYHNKKSSFRHTIAIRFGFDKNEVELSVATFVGNKITTKTLDSRKDV